MADVESILPLELICERRAERVRGILRSMQSLARL